ncbi:unnamed protein product [Arabidopsis lyrata]|uniref:putative F-box/LRR-repeat protein At3g58920 n=1 Tax=Arabidopsis lyrata subsp. lyrata TaxID=81972 RepID=UPI000A29E87E|nr:putative F-box/LRR-repeat protein At3g58920 [Arabidopsis lyrata subsp. lyrata]CAH8269113.1 unnamed protein product [Arabidopsis lyrata]|eukprot:XP_020880592.1 putative F-box/LRR-repeat protein At3g58920 [Arabidopsis lyrata subsp. lyrata]
MSIMVVRSKGFSLLVQCSWNYCCMKSNGNIGNGLALCQVRPLRDLPSSVEIFYGFEGSDFGSITFDTPSLVFLEYVDFVPDEYPFVNFDSLVEAKLDLVLTVHHTWNGELIIDSDNISSNPTNLLKGLKNVQILALTCSSVETFYFFREAIPVFENLHHLSILYGFCWQILRVLLKKSPNLETLVIKGSLHDNQCKPESVCECMSGYSCLLSCPVKILVITRYKGTKGELEQMKHFLGKLSCLVLVTISFWTRDDDEKLRLTTDLLMLPRASVNCKIQIRFSNKLLQVFPLI